MHLQGDAVIPFFFFSAVETTTNVVTMHSFRFSFDRPTGFYGDRNDFVPPSLIRTRIERKRGKGSNPKAPFSHTFDSIFVISPLLNGPFYLQGDSCCTFILEKIYHWEKVLFPPNLLLHLPFFAA